MTGTPQAAQPSERRKRQSSRGTPPLSGDQVIRWIEKVLYLPDGSGRQVKLLPFQKDAIRTIYDNPSGTRRAILSFGRKNGKTALASFLLLNHLCGPAGARARQSFLYSTAQSREQAALIFRMASKIARLSPLVRGAVHVKESAKELHCEGLGTVYRALSAEASTAFGLNPSFTIHDELGQVRGPRWSMYEALETATGAQNDPLSVIISTQAPSDADLMSVLIDDAIAGHDKRTVICLHTAPMDADPFDEATIKIANPAYGKFLNKREVLAQANDARRMPAREAEYRNLILNQRVEASNPFVSPSAWKACAAPVADLRGVRCYAGLDLSSVADLTALVIVGRIDKVWHVHPTFWLPEQGLREKSQYDRVPYDLWASEGYLKTTPGATVSYEHVAKYLHDEIFTRYQIEKVAFDKWNMKHLLPWLVKAGFSEQYIETHFVEFQQGTMSMSPALRVLEEAIRQQHLAHGDHKVLSANAMNAVVYSKDESNRKLDKQKSTGRIDGMVALTMAMGIGSQDKPIDVDALIG